MIPRFRVQPVQFSGKEKIREVKENKGREGGERGERREGRGRGEFFARLGRENKEEARGRKKEEI